ncbi:MAG: hypothetical protein LBE32_05515 [Burkholderiales bacterium]|jgi:phage repressor protein C with HTH and peptisase S24 domain|nr:hypothetical protein [Burkholderiales bacterium]
MNKLNTLAERLKYARSLRGMTQETLRKSAGLSSQAVIGNLETGIRKTSAFIPKIANVLKVNALWLSDGIGLMEDSDEAGTRAMFGTPVALPQSSRIPVVGIVRAGPDGYINQEESHTGYVHGFITLPSKDAAAYAVKAKGDSMYPRVQDGEWIVAEPSVEAQIGDDVIVGLKDGRSMVKRLQWIRDGDISLGSINNAVPPITHSMEEVKYIHRVAAFLPRGSSLFSKE